MNFWVIYGRVPKIYANPYYKENPFITQYSTSKHLYEKNINLFKSVYKDIVKLNDLFEIKNFSFNGALIETKVADGFESSIFLICYDKGLDISLVLSNIQFEDDYFYSDWILYFTQLNNNKHYKANEIV